MIYRFVMVGTKLNNGYTTKFMKNLLDSQLENNKIGRNRTSGFYSDFNQFWVK